MSEKYRLVTRSDFDGLACAVLLKELGLVDDIMFVHPKDMQDGAVSITESDITTNLPYVSGVHLAFDHHHSETVRLDEIADNHIIDPDAPSAARVVYNYYGGKDAFPNVSDEMMAAVDQGDSAQFSEEEVLNADGWALLNHLMDARTGLGRFRDFRISNYDLMMELIDYCRNHSIDEILSLPDVKERVDLYREHQEKAMEQIKSCSTVHGNVVVFDLRQEEMIYACNRFFIYALFPEANISVHVIWGVKKQNTVLAVGKSIFNRTSKTNIGNLMLELGGGGHENSGTCQVDNDQSDKVLTGLIEQMTADG